MFNNILKVTGNGLKFSVDQQFLAKVRFSNNALQQFKFRISVKR